MVNGEGHKFVKRPLELACPARPVIFKAARGMIRQAAAKWPGLTQYLDVTGLGSDPKLIQQLVARAKRRPGRR
jgi:hypothetical protein